MFTWDARSNLDVIAGVSWSLRRDGFEVAIFGFLIKRKKYL